MEHEGLLAAVLAAPDDDVPRLVYADWLDEYGRPERAEFVRCGVEMGRHTDCPVLLRDSARGRPRPLRCGVCGYCLARKRCERLATGISWVAESGLTPPDQGYGYYHLPGLVAPSPDIPGGAVFGLARGFVESVTCTCAGWLAHGPAVVARQPVTRVTLSDRRPQENWRAPGQWAWFTPDFPTTTPRPSQLPPELFLLLKGGRYSYPRCQQWYNTEAESLADLSAAAILWARSARNAETPA